MDKKQLYHGIKLLYDRINKDVTNKEDIICGFIYGDVKYMAYYNLRACGVTKIYRQYSKKYKTINIVKVRLIPKSHPPRVKKVLDITDVKYDDIVKFSNYETDTF